jgi:hypothetical protein
VERRQVAVDVGEDGDGRHWGAPLLNVWAKRSTASI